MPSLHAVYDVELPRPLLISGVPVPNETGEWRFPPGIGIQKVEREDFCCSLTLNQPRHPARVTADKKALFAVYAIEIRISREEEEAPPEVDRDQGNQGFRSRLQYFDSRQTPYKKVAQAIVERVMAFARYKLGMDGARGIGDLGPDCFANPTWFYDDEQMFEAGTITLNSFMDLPLSVSDWSMRGIDPHMRTWLADLSDPSIPLHRELHALSKDAARSGDLRRAVIEMAVAVEVATKHAFFAPASAAFEAFEFLEEKRKVEVTVVELLKQPAARAFGRSFFDVDAEAFRSVEEIFRCRNKVAHRGRLEYRGASGDTVIADRSVVRRWWLAAQTLLNWLESDCELEGIQGLEVELRDE